MTDKLFLDLVNIVGESKVSDKLYERMLYDHDIAPLPPEISLIFNTIPDIVVKPSSVEETSKILKYAYENKIPVIPRGASTWGFGGTIPTNGGIVLELTELKKLSLDVENQTVTVGAGIRWKSLIDYLENCGYTFNVYPSSAISATIGGWIATGGLGIGSLKHGHLKEHVIGLQIITSNGEIKNLSNDNQSESKIIDEIIGSEGTLGIITEATLQIIASPEKTISIAVSFNDFNSLTSVIEKVVVEPVKPYFIEAQDKDYLDLKKAIGIESPDVPILALFVYNGSTSQVEKDVKTLNKLVLEVKGSILPSEFAEKEWIERFYYMRIRKGGPTLLAGEITHPLNKLEEVVNETRIIKKKHNLRMGIKCIMVAEDTVMFMPMYLADERKRWKFVSLLPIVNDITNIGLNAGGGPYGFGIWNSFFLGKVIGDQKLVEIKALKKKMDPNNIMNPSKKYKVMTKFGIPLWGFTFKLFTSVLGLLKYF
ncbi:FAD-binding oxidoreductase [Candidatus Bathyarchaeota archaeon]|nr:FAD-binding oxidoreductase [Candidatus Bathyarchaeota archaeon]